MLHPSMSMRLEFLLAALVAEEIPLRVFETVRLPGRQQRLLQNGTTRAGPWCSWHQYGAAVDMVFRVLRKPSTPSEGTRWSWSEPRRGMWKRYHVLAEQEGLRSLSFEQPHVQLAELPVGLPRAEASVALQERFGQGNDSWRRWLSRAISGECRSAAPRWVLELVGGST